MSLSSVFQLGSTWIGPLLAVAPRRASQADTGQMLTCLIGAVVVISTVCLVMVGITQFVRKRRAFSHAGLFAGLCKHHGLDASNRRLLARIARHFKLKHPARLFLEPRLLDPAKLTSITGSNPKKIAALQMRLFADETSSPAGS